MNSNTDKIFIYVLGSAQDGGYPHVGCTQACCKTAWSDSALHRYPSCIAIVDTISKSYWLFDVTPEIKNQIHMMEEYNCSLKGVFITHAHLGHYLGLMYLGLEAMNLKNIPIYVMPKMKQFLINNPSVKLLIDNQNIYFKELYNNKKVQINQKLSVLPFEVPHRNEYSETVGFRILNNHKSAIYLPDIDSWDLWQENLEDLILKNNILFLDGTFYTKSEIRHRDSSKIPHPSIENTMNRLKDLSIKQKNKVYFIHLNHTNNAIIKESKSNITISDNGFFVAKEKQVFSLN